jgi:hypothetical protein
MDKRYVDYCRTGRCPYDTATDYGVKILIDVQHLLLTENK